MAEQQAPVIQSKKLLLVALVLAGVVVVLFNLGVSQARRGTESKTVLLAAFDHSMKRGDRIREGDLKEAKFPEKYLKQGLPDVVTWDQVVNAEGRSLTQDVRAYEFLQWSHFAQDDRSLPARVISDKEMTTFDFPVDRREIPGNLLVPGTRVNIVGLFTLVGKTSAYIVIDKVRVLAVGGTRDDELSDFGGSRGYGGAALRSYSSVTVEVEPEVALKLHNLRTKAVGRVFWVQLLHPDVAPPRKQAINPELEQLAQTAQTSLRGPEP